MFADGKDFFSDHHKLSLYERVTYQTPNLIVIKKMQTCSFLTGVIGLSFSTDSKERLLVFDIPLRVTKLELARLLQGAIVDPASNGQVVMSASLVERAKWLYAFELKRRSLPGMETTLGDPSWMILLDLFIRGSEGHRTSVSSATLASAAPPTTGLRHICLLEKKGYIGRQAHPKDERSMLLSLTDFGRREVSKILQYAT